MRTACMALMLSCLLAVTRAMAQDAPAPTLPAPPDPVVLEHDWDEARRVMWDYVGIVRSDARLAIAQARMAAIAATVEAMYRGSRVTQDLLELRNIVQVGRLVVESALWRKESRGLHCTESYPDRDDARFLRDTVLVAPAAGEDR